MNSSMSSISSNVIYSKTRMTNSKLLKIDNISLNIYLDGFDVPDFLKTAKLIKMYGGIVSAPDAYTVVLSAPEYSVGTDYLRFHINWLHDSIGKNELQDIGKYLLPSTTDDDYEEFSAGEGTIDDEKEEKLKEEKGETNKKVHESVNELQTSTEPPRLTSELKECKIHIRDIRDKPPQLDRMEFSEISLSHNKQLDDVKLSKLKIQGNENYEKSSTLSTIKRRRKPRGVRTKRRLLYSEEEDKKILQYLIEHSAISKARGIEIWQDMEAAGILPNRSYVSLKLRFKRNLKRNIRKYVDNAEIIAEFEALDN